MSVTKCIKKHNQHILMAKGFNSEHQFMSFLMSLWDYQNSHYKRRYDESPKLLQEKN